MFGYLFYAMGYDVVPIDEVMFIRPSKGDSNSSQLVALVMVGCFVARNLFCSLHLKRP